MTFRLRLGTRRELSLSRAAITVMVDNYQRERHIGSVLGNRIAAIADLGAYDQIKIVFGRGPGLHARPESEARSAEGMTDERFGATRGRRRDEGRAG